MKVDYNHFNPARFSPHWTLVKILVVIYMLTAVNTISNKRENREIINEIFRYFEGESINQSGRKLDGFEGSRLGDKIERLANGNYLVKGHEVIVLPSGVMKRLN